MNKIILQIVIVLSIGFQAFTQTKSKKYPITKPVKKTIYYPQKKPTSTVGKIAIKQPILLNSKDSIQVKKTEIAKKDSINKSQKPFLGPINIGPTSYTTEKSLKTGNSSPNIEKNEAVKSVRKVKRYKEWINSNIEIGFKTGVSLSNIHNFSKIVYSGVNIPDAKYKLGFVGGFFLNIMPKNKIQFRPEILLVQQGAQITESMNRFKYTINYLTVPMHIKVNFGEGKLKYFVAAGPYLGYALSKKSVREIGGKLIVSKIDFIKEFNFFGEKDNRLDYGPIFGGGLRYQYKKAIFEFETNYQIGMAYPIVYKTDRPFDLGNTGKNRVYTSSIGIIWPL